MMALLRRPQIHGGEAPGPSTDIYLNVAKADFAAEYSTATHCEDRTYDTLIVNPLCNAPCGRNVGTVLSNVPWFAV